MRKNNEFDDQRAAQILASGEESDVGWGDATTEEESGAATGTGGQTGAVEFRYHDAYSLGPRDDMLPPTEINRLLAVIARTQSAQRRVNIPFSIKIRMY